MRVTIASQIRKFGLFMLNVHATKQCAFKFMRELEKVIIANTFSSYSNTRSDELSSEIKLFKVCSFTATRYINHVSLATLV